MEPKQYGYIIIWDCGGSDFLGNTHQAKINGQIGIMYLLSHLGPPPAGSALEVIEAHYTGPFLCVALGFYDEPDGAREYANTAEIALEIFNAAVDWKKIEAASLSQEVARMRERPAYKEWSSKYRGYAEPTLTDIVPAPNRESRSNPSETKSGIKTV